VGEESQLTKSTQFAICDMPVIHNSVCPAGYTAPETGIYVLTWSLGLRGIDSFTLY